MEITNDELTFDSEDRALWRAFLSTRAGLRLLPKLLESAPRLLETGSRNAILIRTGKVAGFQDAASALLSLASEEHKQVTVPENSNYPSLDNDAAWTEVGHKPTPE